MSDSDSVNTIDETVSTKKYGKFNLNANFKHVLPKKSIIHYFGKISYGIYMYSNVQCRKLT